MFSVVAGLKFLNGACTSTSSFDGVQLSVRIDGKMYYNNIIGEGLVKSLSKS